MRTLLETEMKRFCSHVAAIWKIIHAYDTQTRIWRSEDRASWDIILKANEMHYFSNLFDKVPYK
jgi:hypothetical protein